MTFLPSQNFSGMTIATLLVTVLAAPPPTTGQVPTLCDGCAFSLERVVEISSEPVEVTPSLAVSVALHPDGGYLVSHLFQAPTVIHYDGAGHPLAVYQARGQGPGELNSAPRIHVGGGGDLLFVESRGGRRFHWLDGAFNSVGSHLSDVVIGEHVVVLDDETVVVATDLLGPRQGRFGLARLDRSGDLIHAFGLREGALPGPSTWVTEGTGTSILTGSFDRSVVERRTPGGEVLEEVRIDRSWFPEGVPHPAGAPFRERPEPRTVAARLLYGNTLILLSTVAASGWEPLSGGPPSFDPATLDLGALFDTVIETVDLTTGQVLARRVVEGALAPVSGSPALFYSTREDALGNVTISIWRVRFTASR